MGVSIEVATAIYDPRAAAATAQAVRLGQNPRVADRVLGAWTTSYDPTVTQSAGVGHTVNVSEWRYDGPMVDWVFSITMSAAGSAGSPITLTLPVNVVSSTARPVGSGTYSRNTALVRYVGTFETASTSTIQLLHDASDPSKTGVGNDPSYAIASGDTIRGTVRYRWV